MSTGVLHGPAELAGRALHYLVHDAGCIFVPAQTFPDGKYLVFEFSRCYVRGEMRFLQKNKISSKYYFDVRNL